MAAELDFVVDEELAAEDKEQRDARDDLRGMFVQTVVRSNLNGALVQEGQQGGNRDHDKRIHLCQPGHDNGGKATAACGAGGDGAGYGGNCKETGQTAFSTAAFGFAGKLLPNYVGGKYLKNGPFGNALREMVYKPKYINKSAIGTAVSENFWDSAKNVAVDLIW